jgi:5-methylcytosine-specific restriction endonuclease McrA
MIIINTKRKAGNRIRNQRRKLKFGQRVPGTLAWERYINSMKKRLRTKTGKRKWYRVRVLERDDYKCQVCGLREPEIMEVDHIKSVRDFPELSYEMRNLQTLCPNCHKRKSIKNQEYSKLKKIQI